MQTFPPQSKCPQQHAKLHFYSIRFQIDKGLGHKRRLSATKEALFEGDGIIIVEKYCDACTEPKEFERLQTIYSRIP